MTTPNSKKHMANRRRHNFLNDAFFKDVSGYGECRDIPGWVLVKHINGDTGDYEVAIYTDSAFEKYERYNQKNDLFSQGQGDELDQVPMR